MRHDRYGLGSSQYTYSSGMDASFVDPLIVRPHTSWRGTRGVRVAFGEDRDGLDADSEYGRLYRGSEYAEPELASPGDLGALVGRSGSSGFRGGRPTFGAGATVTVGPVQYQGSDWGAFFLGVGGIVLLGRMSGAW